MNRENSPLRANRETAGKQYGAAAMVLPNKQWHMVPLLFVSVPCVRAFALKRVCLFVCVRCAMAFALLLRTA